MAWTVGEEIAVQNTVATVVENFDMDTFFIIRLESGKYTAFEYEDDEAYFSATEELDFDTIDEARAACRAFIHANLSD